MKRPRVKRRCKPIWFACLWNRCETTDAGEVAGFTILTGPSAGWQGDCYDGAPVIPEKFESRRWLDPVQSCAELLGEVQPQRF